MQGNIYNIPPNAVVAGRDRDGALLYAGRAFHEGDIIPAKVAPHLGSAFVAYGGEESAKHDFEVNKTNIIIVNTPPPKLKHMLQVRVGD